MIQAQVGSDGFVIWSVPYEHLCGLVPRHLVPTRFENRGWLAVAAVELRHIRIFGCPLPQSLSLAAWLAVVDIDGGRRRGNYFLKLYTGSSLLRRSMRMVAPAQETCNQPVIITRDDRHLRLQVGDEVTATIERTTTVTTTQSRRLQSLFASNRSGIGPGRFGICESRVTKDHWHMRPHSATISQARFISGMAARQEFAFDASIDNAHWALPRWLAPHLQNRDA